MTALAILASSLPTFADDASVTIVLKGGAKYRGTLVEEVPNDHVTIQLATGEVKRFAWADINRGGDAPAPPLPPPSEPGPVVHIVGGSSDVVLERMVGKIEGTGYRAKHFAVVCTAPCDRVVASGGGYRVTGEAFGKTSAFALGAGGETRIEIDPGDRTTRNIAFGSALALIAVGSGLAVYAGTAMDKDDKARNTVLGIACVALVGSIVGFIVAARNGPTVRVDGRKVGDRYERPTVALTASGLVF